MIRLNTPDLFQWDTGHYIILYPPANYPNISEVHFSNENDKNALVSEVILLDNQYIAYVPDELLTSPDRLFCYAVYINSEDRTTDERKIFNIIERAKPEDYHQVIRHNILIDRDAADAHPISAITGLQEALNEKTEVNSVKYIEQTLTDKQKAQARENIDALKNDAIAALVSSTPVAIKTNDIINLTAQIVQTNGVLSAGTNTITLAKVASTGMIEDLNQNKTITLRCGTAE